MENFMKFKTIFGEVIDTPCVGCVVNDNSKFNEGRIFQTKLWDISQDFEIPYPGMIVISPMRHVSNYIDLSEEELHELQQLIILCKKAIVNIFNCPKVAYMFYDKPNGHIHFVIIPLHGLVEINDKYAVLSELFAKAPDLLKDKQNMQRVVKAIDDLKTYFQNITL